MKNNQKPGVIVLGGHVQGYGIVRIYGENHIPSIVIDSTRINIARHSKYCQAFLKADYDGLIDLLIELGRKGRYNKWLILPTDDYYVRLLSQYKNKLEKYFIVTVDDWEKINLFFNKRNAYPLAREAGVPVPETFYPDSIDDLERISFEIKFPCIIKPAIMLDFYKHFKKKVFVCNDADELKTNYRKATEIIDPRELLLQEIIPGPSENQYSVGIFFDRDRSYNFLAARRKRQHPIDFGNATTYAETVDIPVLIEYALKILTGAGFFGVCEVEFKFDERDRQYKFLEVNARTWKWHLIGKSARIPFLSSLYQYFVEGSPIVEKKYEKAAWKDSVTDVPVIFSMKKKGLYKRAEKSRLVSAVANRYDLAPFIYQLIYLPYFYFKR